MKKYLACALALALSLSLLACQNLTSSSSAILEATVSAAQVEAEVTTADALKLEKTSELEPQYVTENQIPYVIWNEIPEANRYKVLIKRESQGKASLVVTDDLRVEVFPGEEVSYQIIPLSSDGTELTELASEALLVEHIVKGKLGGVKSWLRPDQNYSYRSKNEFPEGLYWSAELADEIVAWLNKTYSKEYLLSGHIAEPGAKNEWLAPMTPEDRVQGEWEGNGLDCVGFVNGFFYLYTQAFAGEDYRVLDREMDESYGVYGCPTAPTAALAYTEHLVIKPNLGGTFADETQIRPGDMIMSRDHSWIVSDEGEGLKSKIWEYEDMRGFSRHRTLESIQTNSPDNPHDYWMTTIANPLESYGKIQVLAVNQAGETISGGRYVLKDLYGRTLALEDEGTQVYLYRPDGDDFFKKIFTMDETDEFYDDEASFTLEDEADTLNRVIGGSYVLEEMQAPFGYKTQPAISIEISPGEEQLLKLVYTKDLRELDSPSATAAKLE